MAAIADVAKLAGVSKSTASRALSGHGYVSNETRLRVESAAAAIGFVVSSNASSLVTGQSRNIGVIIPSINRWFFAEVLEGIESALIAAGYDLTLYRLTTDELQRRRVFNYFLVRKRVDAVVTVGIHLTPHEVELLHALRGPIVGIGGDIAGISSLSIDNVRAGQFVTDHLIGLGHTRIMYFGGHLDDHMDLRVNDERLDGVRRALAEANLSHALDFKAVQISIQGGFYGALSVLADPVSRPTAIVAGCDEVAIGVIVAARQLGIQVPSQLSVIGIDGHPLADMFQLTTLEQNPEAQGVRAVDLLMARLGRSPERLDAERVEMPVALAVRGSTTAPRS